MKRIIFIFLFFCIIDPVWGQQKPQPLTLIVVIDNNVCEDVINGKFIIKDNDGRKVDEMPFSNWVGKLEMTTKDYKKLFTVKSQDSLYLTFENNNFALDTEYVYERKIPKGMMNPQYLILKIYNEKNKESRAKYLFPGNNRYVIQVVSPGINTRMKMVDKN